MFTIHKYNINGIPIETGDLICTTDGGKSAIGGQFWQLIGKLLPGVVDHIVVYIGPDGRCVEAGAKGRVITFDAGDNQWDASRMKEDRGGLLDFFYGIAYPLANRGLSEDRIKEIRAGVAEYCIRQADAQKPYNLNFLNSETEDAFYCSQLGYKAYLGYGIDLNTGMGIPNIPGTASIVFPHEIWESCSHKQG